MSRLIDEMSCVAAGGTAVGRALAIQVDPPSLVAYSE
jgi:hypothetical protein